MTEGMIGTIGTIVGVVLAAVVKGYHISLKTQKERLEIQDEQIEKLVARLDATDKVVDNLLATQARMKRQTNKILLEIEKLIDSVPIDKEKIKEKIRKGITDEDTGQS